MAADWTKFDGEDKKNRMVGNGLEERNWFVESEAGKRIGKDCFATESKIKECLQRQREEDHDETRGSLRGTPVLLGAGDRACQGKNDLINILDNGEDGENVEGIFDFKRGSVPENEELEEEDEERQSILRNSSREGKEDQSQDMQESGSRIRREAKEELMETLQNSPKRPSSLYNKEDTQSPRKLKSAFAEKLAGSQLDPTGRICSPGSDLDVECQRVSEKSTEKLVNGKSPKEDKHVYHVQFNKDPKKKQQLQDQTAEDKPHPSPSVSISSSTSSSSSEDNSSLGQFSETRPPDGGWGWVVVAAAFMVNLIADGITFSFGVIFVEFLNYFGEGKSKTAWIGSLFMAMPLLSGPVASFLTDRYGCRKVSIAGSILATTGFVISSFASSMELLIFTFGVIAGFGLSLCFVAAVVIVAYYFDKKRSFATGLSVCGSGIGTFIFAPVTQYLLAEYGWRGTTLILAGLFLNLAVCGCLMRDLEWTTTRAKAKTEERKQKRRSRSRMQSSSADSFSAASSSANTTTQTPHGDPKRTFASANAMIVENLRSQNEEQEAEDAAGKLSASLVSLPTFVKNGEKVPLEVLELLSARKGVYNVLLQNYPGLLISSRSFSDSGTLHEQLNAPVTKAPSTPSPLLETRSPEDLGNDTNEMQNDTRKTPRRHPDASYLWWLKKIQPDCPLQRAATLEHPRRLPAAYLKDIKAHRHSSLTYRGAILNINRYRLRASSCPDIYRNSMTTSAKTQFVRYPGLWEFWDLIVDMLDFSYFADSRFLLFAISNFLLHFWYDVPYVYLTDNAIEMGFSETDASILISVIGITNMVGEIILGWAGDRAWVNASMVYAVCMSLCGAFTALIPVVVNRYYLLCCISGAFGLFIAANYSLTSIILVELITLERFTNAYGLLLLVQGVANLMGPPLAGWLYDITRTYDLSFYLAGLFIALSGALLMVMPLLEFYRKWKSRSEGEKAEKNFAKINNV